MNNNKFMATKNRIKSLQSQDTDERIISNPPSKQQNESPLKKNPCLNPGKLSNNSTKKIEFASQVIEIKEDTIKVRSLTITPIRGRPPGKALNDKVAHSKVQSPLYSVVKVKNQSVDRDLSVKSILSSGYKKTYSEDIGISNKYKINKDNTDKIDATNDKKQNQALKNVKTYKNYHRVSCERGKKSPCNERELTRETGHEVLINRLKIPQEPRKKSKPRDKKSNKNEIKTPKSKKSLDEPLNGAKPKKLIDTFSAKSPKVENYNRVKPADKRNAKTNRVKILKPSLKTPKNKKLSEDIQLKNGLDKEKRVKFNDFHHFFPGNSIKSESNPSSSASSLNVSDTAEWVNLNCQEFVGKMSDFVGEFIQKISCDNQLFKDRLRRSVEDTKTQTEECSGSSYSEIGYEVIKVKETETKTVSVPLLKLAALKDKKSDSSRYCEQDGVIYDSKDSIFLDLGNKNTGTRSARGALDSYKSLRIK